jgi:ABC-type spermidine/putrescine transport system permease subunit I
VAFQRGLAIDTKRRLEIERLWLTGSTEVTLPGYVHVRLPVRIMPMLRVLSRLPKRLYKVDVSSMARLMCAFKALAPKNNDQQN